MSNGGGGGGGQLSSFQQAAMNWHAIRVSHEFRVSSPGYSSRPQLINALSLAQIRCSSGQNDIQLREFDRCRILHEKFLQFSPENCTTWIKFAEMETLLGDVDRARAIFELAIKQPMLDMPEVLWKSYIDFEVSQEEFDYARNLYKRLLNRTQHVKINPDQVRFITTTNNNTTNNANTNANTTTNNNGVVIAATAGPLAHQQQQQQQVQLQQQVHHQQIQLQPQQQQQIIFQQPHQTQQQYLQNANAFVVQQQQPRQQQQQQPQQFSYVVAQQQQPSATTRHQPSTSSSSSTKQSSKQSSSTTTGGGGSGSGGPSSFTSEVKEFLEEEFQTNPSATVQRRSELAQASGLTANQIKNWFGDRRKKEYKRTGVRPACAPNGVRRRFPPEQRRILELELNLNSELESQRVENISQATGLTPKQIRTWFRDNRKKLNKEFL